MSLNVKLRTLVASAALIGLSATPIGAAAQATCQGNQRAFSSNVDFFEYFNPLSPPQGICFASGKIDGTTTILDVKASVKTVDCITPVQNTATNFFNSTQVTFDFGNGLFLYAAYGGQATATSMLTELPTQPEELKVVGGLTFTGGTGRFTNAKGTATLIGSERFVGFDDRGAVYEGRITLSGCIGGVR